MAELALTRLLPQMKASDASLLHPKQRAILYKMLRPLHVGAHAPLICAILRALEQVGDQSAFAPVSKLARMRTFTPTQNKVRDAAANCLSYLSLNSDNARNSQTLLRASSAMSVTTPDMLLRPAASYAQETPAEQLLRPTQND